MTDRELMQMALDALNNFDKGNHGMRWQVPIIKALRSRLANEFNPDWNQVEALQESLREHMAEIQRLRARLAQPEPWVKTYSGGKPNYTESCERCGEVNPAEIHTCTPKQPEQEPVAFYVYKPTLPRGNLGNVADGDLPWIYDQDPSSGYSARMLVYTAPPQREWQGLTDEEYEAMAEKHVTNCYFDTLKYAKAIEAKLKGKNSTSVMNQQTSDKND